MPIYFIGYLSPRVKRIWVFGEAHGFNNNSKYFFYEVLNNHKDIHAIWIGDRNTVAYLSKLHLPAYYRYSFMGIFYSLFAKVYIVSSTPGDVNFYTSCGAKIINLWHGVGTKTVLWTNPLHKEFKQKGKLSNFLHFLEYPHLYIKPDLVLATSETMKKVFFKPMFDVPEEKIVVSVYPRCKFMMQPIDSLVSHIEKYEQGDYMLFIDKIKTYGKVIIYAPTFRDNGNDFIKESGIDFVDLDNIMRERNWIFIVKLHPATKYDIKRFSNLSNVIFLDNRFDLYLLMPFSDMLISDYSSIVYDYLLLNKPIEIYAFDYMDYVTKNRKLQIPFDYAIRGFSYSDNYEDLKNHLKIDTLIDSSVVNVWWTDKYELFESVEKLSYE